MNELKVRDIKAGNLLIAEPFMEDPNFKRTVILITENNPEGILGLILNRPSIFKLNEVLSDFPKFESSMYIGGPVGLDRLNFVHCYPDLISNSFHITDNLYWNGNFEDLKKGIFEKKILPHNIKFFLGYSGWDSNQLENELEEKSWIVSQNYTNIFKGSSYMWKDILKKMGGEYKIIANAPDNPNLN